MRTRKKTRLTREGWYYLFVLAFVLGGAILRDINLLLVFGGMLLGPLLMSWWMAWRSLRGITIERQLPEQVGAGDLIVVGLTLTNCASRVAARFVTVEDVLLRIAPVGSEISLPASVQFQDVPARETKRLAYRGQLPRGRYQLGPLRVRTRFPLGLLERTIELDQPEEIVVVPRLGRLIGMGRSVRQETWLGNRRAQHRHGSLEADFYGLRDWRAGDSRRWIHWRTSARRGGLMVRQFEQPRHEDLVVLVELWQPAAPDLRQQENVELALSYAATVLVDACRLGNCKLLMGVAGRNVAIRQGAASRPLLEEAMRTLAVAEASELPDTSGLLQTLRQMRAGGNLLVVSSRPVELPTDTRAALPTNRVSLVNVDSHEFSEMFLVPAPQDYSPSGAYDSRVAIP